MPDRFLGGDVRLGCGWCGMPGQVTHARHAIAPDPPLRICDLASTEWPTYPLDAALGSRQHALAKTRDRHCASDAASDICGRQLGHAPPAAHQPSRPCVHIISLDPLRRTPDNQGGPRPVSRLSSPAKTFPKPEVDFRGRFTCRKTGFVTIPLCVQPADNPRGLFPAAEKQTKGTANPTS